VFFGLGHGEQMGGGSQKVGEMCLVLGGRQQYLVIVCGDEATSIGGAVDDGGIEMRRDDDDKYSIMRGYITYYIANNFWHHY